MKISNLKYPPIKNIYPKKMPKFILKQERFINREHIPTDNFILYSISSKNKNNYCKMQCYPQIISRGEKIPCRSLYIHHLEAKKTGIGLGTKMLDFAQLYSKKIGCGGRFHLFASRISISDNIPHIFYKKYGMNTGYNDIDKKLSNFVKKNKVATFEDFKTIPMFFPPIENKNITSKVIKFINKLFK